MGESSEEEDGGVVGLIWNAVSTAGLGLPESGWIYCCFSSNWLFVEFCLGTAGSICIGLFCACTFGSLWTIDTRVAPRRLSLCGSSGDMFC